MDLLSIQQHPKEFILKYSIPSIIAMVLTSLVTIVDGLFISNYVGKEALSAIQLGLPLLYVFLAIAIMIGVGGVSIAGRRLGQGDKDHAINVFNQTYSTAFISIVLLSLVSYLLLGPALDVFDLPRRLQYHFLTYYKIILFVYPLMMMNIVGGMFIRAEGKPQLFMFITLIMNITNIALDYYLIGQLKLGVSGAAIASTISIVIGYVVMLIFFTKLAKIFRLKRFTFSMTDFKQTLYNGSSEFIGQLSFSITIFLFNSVVLTQIGLSGLAAMTLVGYAGYLFNMIVIGFGQGISPIISYSYGAQNMSLCFVIRDQTLKLLTSVAFIVYLLLAIFSPTYTHLFTRDITVSAYMVTGLRLYSLSFLLIGYNVISSFFFTATGYPKESAIISAMRGLILLSFLIFLLPSIWGILGVWLVAPITELLTALVSLYLFNDAFDSLHKPLNNLY